MDAIRTEGLGKTYKEVGHTAVRSLHNLDLVVEENEVFGFLGRNGAGKTTTIKILCSLLKASAGEAFIFDERARSRAARRMIGYLPEQPYFYEYLTPRETIEFYARLQGLSAQERRKEWEKLADMLDLGAIADQRIKGFSKGMRQRIGFAVALVGNPPLLILDEPMSGLDPLGRRMIRELILQQRDQKKTIFFSSHVLGDVEQICDRVGMLVKGQLTQTARIDALLANAQLKQVEVILAKLSQESAAALAQQAQHHRCVETDHIFLTDGMDAANRLAQQALAQGATLIAFNPIRESLEDYFMRKQEGTFA